MTSQVNGDETDVPAIVMPHRNARRVTSFVANADSPVTLSSIRSSPADPTGPSPAGITPTSIATNQDFECILEEGIIPTTTGTKYRFKGVRQRSWGVWVSEVREPMTRKKVWLGTYPSAEEAIRAHDLALLMVRNVPDSRLNRPQSQQRPAIVQRSVATALLLAARAGHAARCRVEAEKGGRIAAPPDFPVTSFSSELVKLELIGSNVHLTDYFPHTHTHTHTHTHAVTVTGSDSDIGDGDSGLGIHGQFKGSKGGALTAASATSPYGSQCVTPLAGRKRKGGVLPSRSASRDHDRCCGSGASGDASGDASGGTDAQTAQRQPTPAMNVRAAAGVRRHNGGAEQPAAACIDGAISRVMVEAHLQAPLCPAATMAAKHVKDTAMGSDSSSNCKRLEAQAHPLADSASGPAPSNLLHLLAAASESATCEPSSPVDSMPNAERLHATERASTTVPEKTRRGIMLFGVWQDAQPHVHDTGSPVQSVGSPPM